MKTAISPGFAWAARSLNRPADWRAALNAPLTCFRRDRPRGAYETTVAAAPRRTEAAASRLELRDRYSPSVKPLGFFTLIALTNAWLLVWQADFQAGDADLIFGDQEEMGFGARVATAITEQNGGVITSSAGLKTAKNTWGQPAEWCDYSGTVDGQIAGITLMTHPDNFRPTWFHNREW
jgi:hypothetical protein